MYLQHSNEHLLNLSQIEPSAKGYIFNSEILMLKLKVFTNHNKKKYELQIVSKLMTICKSIRFIKEV